MEFVTVTYRGPSGCYSVEHEGKWYEFVAGRALAVPETLAERLLDVEGHTYLIGDEVEVATVENQQGTESLSIITDAGGSGSGSGEGSGSGDGPERVNAASSYLGN